MHQCRYECINAGMNASMQELMHGIWGKHDSRIGTSKRNRNTKLVIGVQQQLIEKYQRRLWSMIAEIEA
jgi:hypothetical protein